MVKEWHTLVNHEIRDGGSFAPTLQLQVQPITPLANGASIYVVPNYDGPA